jgi:hypothetical protein
LLGVTETNPDVYVVPNVLTTALATALGMQPPLATGTVKQLQMPQNVALLRAQLLSGWTVITDVTNTIDSKSSQYIGIQNTNYLLPSQWASSGSGIGYQLPIGPSGWEALFASYWTVLSEVSLQRVPYIYSRNDFWHGHLAFSGAQQTWFVLFHAAEYPYDLEERKDGYAEVVGPPGSYSAISSVTEYFKVRNGIYTFRDNTLRVLNFNNNFTSSNPYWNLLYNWQAVSVPDDYLFDVDTTLTASLNWFSAEGVPLFLH